LCSPKGGPQRCRIGRQPKEITRVGYRGWLLVRGCESQPWLIALKPVTGESLRRSGTKHVLSRCGRASLNRDNVLPALETYVLHAEYTTSDKDRIKDVRETLAKTTPKVKPCILK
jgi:hypothetical protein